MGFKTIYIYINFHKRIIIISEFKKKKSVVYHGSLESPKVFDPKGFSIYKYSFFIIFFFTLTDNPFESRKVLLKKKIQGNNP